MEYHLGEEGTEQFEVVTRVDGREVGRQKIHDPFIRSKAVVGISRWDHFLAIFKSRTITVETRVDGSEGAILAIMTLNPNELAAETAHIIAERTPSREAWARGEYGDVNRIQSAE